MPNYDPAVLAQILRSKAGSSFTPSEMQFAAMSPAEKAAMQAQQQQMAQEQLRQRTGAALAPAEKAAIQRMSPMPMIEPRAQTVPMPQVAPQNAMGVPAVPMPDISRQDAIRQAMQQQAGAALSPYELQQLQMQQQRLQGQ
jgi:hypothetical protein